MEAFGVEERMNGGAAAAATEKWEMRKRKTLLQLKSKM